MTDLKPCQCKSNQSIDWKPIERLTKNYRNIILHKKVLDYSGLIDTYATAEIVGGLVFYSGWLEKYDLNDAKRRFTHFAELTPPKS